MSDIEPQPAAEPDQMRSASEVAQRCLVLYAVLAAGYKGPTEDIVEWLHRERLWSAVSPEEARFLLSSHPTRQQMIDATWRAAALVPLLWALGAVDSLPSQPAGFDIELLRSVLPPLFGPTAEFIATAVLRNEADIRKAHEDTSLAHWAVRDAKLNNKPVPHNYDPSIIQERHQALNWLTFCGQDWDEVTTDT